MAGEDIKLGAKVRDSATGFTGVVTGLCTYLSGSSQILVEPPSGDSRWIQTARAEVVDQTPA